MDNGGEGETKRWACRRCGHVGLEESDGFYYCQECGAQADDIILTGVADEDFIDKGGDGGPLYSARFTRHSQPTRNIQTNPSSQAWFRYTQEQEEQEQDYNNIYGGFSYTKVKKEERHDDGDYYGDGIGPVEPEDFGGSAYGGKLLSYEDYYNEVRFRYLMGMQWMIQLQCESLVENFNARPLICGIAGNVWLRFLASTGVFKDSWADDVVVESESQRSGEPVKREPRSSHKNEPQNAYGERAVMIWFKYLRKTIPLSYSLAISFLACHVAREAILPTDFVKWSLEGKLPYFAAHVEIEKRFERSSLACPISSSRMFRPSQTVPIQKLESMAATISEAIGLHLPPVNFYEIARRYLKTLTLQLEKILPHACHIYEWSMPPDLWLSTNELRLPTRVCVMSILIVAIRILYNLNGFGAWERSLTNRISSPLCGSHLESRLDSRFSCEMQGDAETGSPLHRMDDSGEKFIRNLSTMETFEFDPAELVHHLEAKYGVIGDMCDFTKDLPSYLQYCKDVVFAGAGPSHVDDLVEEELIEKFWDFYQNAKDLENAEEPRVQSGSIFSSQKRSRSDDESVINLSTEKKIKEENHDSSYADISSDNADGSSRRSVDNDNISNNSLEDLKLEQDDKDSERTLKERAITRLKLDMEEKRFCYIPPRVNLKRFDYLHYVRKKGEEGALTYAAHADYYILLRACARVAQVDIRNMHMGVLSFERRLAWLEKRIDHCLHLTPPSITCEFCRNIPDHSHDDPIGISKLNL